MSSRLMTSDRWKALVAFVAAAAVLLVPFVVADRYLIRILTVMGINLIMVSGLSLLFGYAGQISLGHAAFYGLGAYTSGFLVKAGVMWPIGLLLALPSLRLKGHYLAMATLGFGEIMHFVFTEAEWFTGGSNGLRGIPAASVGSVVFETPASKYLLVWVTVCIVLLLAANIVRHRPGRALRAIHGSETGAQACGIDTVRLKVGIFVISAGLGGLAGVLYAHYVGFVSPSTFTLHYSLVLVTMVALGGMGSLAGAVAGTVLLTLLPYADAIIPGLPRQTIETLQDWERDIHGMVLILVMLFMPGGLAGWGRSLAGRLALWRRARPTRGEDL